MEMDTVSGCRNIQNWPVIQPQQRASQHLAKQVVTLLNLLARKQDQVATATFPVAPSATTIKSPAVAPMAPP
eukprot:9680930-Ditylum_brightwellii.AAC.1